MLIISNFCNQINQACNFKIKKVCVSNSKFIIYACFILYKLGFIINYRIACKFVIINLKYNLNGSTIRGLFSLSKPSLNFFIKSKNLRRYAFNNLFGLNGFLIISTNKKKLMLDVECILSNTGGVPFFAVY